MLGGGGGSFVTLFFTTKAMKPNYRRLQKIDRGVIYRMNKAGKTQSEIAQTLGFSQGSISKELKRNKGQRGYRETQSHKLTLQRLKMKPARSCVTVGDLELEVQRRLKLKHSPEQISVSLRRLDQHVSHETIYNYIPNNPKECGDLYKELRIDGKCRYRRRAGNRCSKIPNRKGRDQRPSIVDKRERFRD